MSEVTLAQVTTMHTVAAQLFNQEVVLLQIGHSLQVYFMHFSCWATVRWPQCGVLPSLRGRGCQVVARTGWLRKRVDAGTVDVSCVERETHATAHHQCVPDEDDVYVYAEG